MAKRLTEHISSLYIGAANRLQGRGRARRIVAYVESYDDVMFWRSFLSEFETPERRFEVMLPACRSLGHGKKLALSGNLGPNLIACVDADLDYMLQGTTLMSRDICQNPYIIHTYAYAIESYQCYAPLLHDVCVKATLNDHAIVDLEGFMRQLSVIMHPLFVWLVWAHRHALHNQFCIRHFAQTVAFDEVNVYNPERTLESVRTKVNKKIASLQRTFPQARDDWKSVRDDITCLGCTPDNTYLYIQGHTLMDDIVLPLLTPICTILRREREREIQQMSCHEVQRQNELSCYHHTQCAPEFILRKNTDYRTSPPYQQMRHRLQQMLTIT
ncbi:MAG: DUF4435 domain-containing protein [Bacteroidaceae bacterium]|nr:DUF4435 domain-containing protein [Bacteroidaceae bacterium]